MAFQQFKLTKSINQARGIFDKYLYESETDSIATVSTSGYFDASRYAGDDGWQGGIIECLCSDGYFVGEITGDTLVAVLVTGGAGVSFNIVEVTSNYTVLPTDDGVSGTGTFNVTLFPSADAINYVTVKSVEGGGTLTILPDGSETIEGLSSATCTAGQSKIFMSVAAGWVIV